jgi:hypothetical protein
MAARSRTLEQWNRGVEPHSGCRCTVELGYNDIRLYDTSSIALDIVWHQLTPRCQPWHYTARLERSFIVTQNIPTFHHVITEFNYISIFFLRLWFVLSKPRLCNKLILRLKLILNWHRPEGLIRQGGIQRFKRILTALYVQSELIPSENDLSSSATVLDGNIANAKF